MNNLTFSFGAPVHCQDEECGQLSKVIFDPETREVTKLVIEKGLPLKTARIFPISVVEAATEEAVIISVPREELRDYPEYEEVFVEKVPEGRELEPVAIQSSPYGLRTGLMDVPPVMELYIEGVADHLAPMGKDTPVEAIDETVGRVYGVVVTPKNNLIIEVLVHKGTIFVEEFFLSAAAVERMSHEGVFLDISKDELDELIEFDEKRDHYWYRLPTDTKLESGSS